MFLLVIVVCWTLDAKLKVHVYAFKLFTFVPKNQHLQNAINLFCYDRSANIITAKEGECRGVIQEIN